MLLRFLRERKLESILSVVRLRELEAGHYDVLLVRDALLAWGRRSPQQQPHVSLRELRTSRNHWCEEDRRRGLGIIQDWIWFESGVLVCV